MSKIVGRTSLAVCLLVVAAWITAGWQEYGISWTRGSQVRSLVLARDEVVYMAWESPHVRDSRFNIRADAARFGYGEGWWGFWLSGGRINGLDYLTINAPYWFFLILAGLPAVIIAARNRASYPLPGHCRHCGYDLTANVSGICPECGKAIVAASAGK